MTNRFEDYIERRRLEALARIDRIPVAALIWGPAPDGSNLIADTRLRLRDELNSRGHHARFSEELVDPSSYHSILAQQIAQAEAFDIVFSIPASPGSIAEVHDFARIPELSYKVVAFLNSEWDSGYSNQSLIQIRSNVTCQIQPYRPVELPDCIIRPALELVRRLQEYFYANGRRF
jgi:hypothetical protein